MTKNVYTILITLLFCFFLDSSLNAKCRRVATVKYETSDGWSKSYTVNVTFMTGTELNQATNSYDYRSASVYAIIFWSKGQATVIKLNSTFLCGYEVDCSCIDGSFMDYKGYDQDGDKWNICLSDFCF